MKKQGFATSGVLYTVLLLFVALLFGVLQNLQNKKTILDQLKIETISALNCDCAYLREEIDILKKKLTWKKVGDASGTSQVSLPNDFQELMIVAKFHHPNADSNHLEKVTFYILNDELSSTNFTLENGNTLENDGRVALTISKQSVQLLNWYYGTTDYTSVATISVYSR